MPGSSSGVGRQPLERVGGVLRLGPGAVHQQEQRVRLDAGDGDLALVDLLLARRGGGQHELVGHEAGQQDLAVHELGAVAVPDERPVGEGTGSSGLGPGRGFGVSGLHDIGGVGIEQTARGSEGEQEGRKADTAVHGHGHGCRPGQKPMLSRAVQYCTCGCDSKSLLEKLSWPKALTSGSTPL